MMTKMFKYLVALTLLGIGGSLFVHKNIDNVIVVDIVIDKPSEEIIQQVKPIADIVTDKNDRLKIAIFNQEFAQRIVNYNTDLQKVNDVYVLAGSFYFQNDMKGKYPKLASNIIQLVKDITGEDNHFLSEEEKKQISDKFIGLSWSLINKR